MVDKVVGLMNSKYCRNDSNFTIKNLKLKIPMLLELSLVLSIIHLDILQIEQKEGRLPKEDEDWFA